MTINAYQAGINSARRWAVTPRPFDPTFDYSYEAFEVLAAKLAKRRKLGDDFVAGFLDEVTTAR